MIAAASNCVRLSLQVHVTVLHLGVSQPGAVGGEGDGVHAFG